MGSVNHASSCLGSVTGNRLGECDVVEAKPGSFGDAMVHYGPLSPVGVDLGFAGKGGHEESWRNHLPGP